MRAWFKCRLFAASLTALCSQAALTNPNPSVFSRENGINVSLTANDENHSIDIADLSLDVKVHGNLAEVAMDVTLANSSDDDVEANFALNLPSDAVVNGYALEINGTMINGVLVDQPKAKAVYEDEIREGIDPGLAEIAPGNVFRTRVYPVPAKGERKISLRFVAPVDLATGFILPLETDAAVSKFNVSITAEGVKTAPAINLPFTGKFALSKQGGKWTGKATAPVGSKLSGMLHIAATETGNDMLISTHENGDDFFQISGKDTKRLTKPFTVQRMRVYWDSSLSRRDDMLDEEIALIADVAAKAGNPAIDLIRFSAAAPDISNPAGISAAADMLRSTTYRGGTSFRGLDNLKLADADLCLLFSDGTPTIETDADFRPDCRLMIVTSGPEANGLRLGMIARASKGQFLRLGKDNRAKIAEQIMKPAVAVVSARSDDGRKLPFRAQTAPDGSWFVVGRAPESGDVHLSIAGLGSGLSRKIYTLASNGTARSNAAASLWAAEELERLADNPLKRKAMRKMSQDYNVASSTMALLVLEEPGQYLRADIKPPKGFDGEWMEEYRDAKKQQDEEFASNKAERLSNVYEAWSARKKWWNTVFVAPKRVKNKRQPVNTAAGDAAAEGADASAEVAAPVSAAPPQQGYDEGYGEEDIANIVVTANRIDSASYDVALSVNAITTDEDGNSVKMEIADVLSDQPYLKALNEATAEKRLAVFGEQEKLFGSLPAFYLDTAEWFRLKGDQALSDALLLSALELPVTDDETRLIVAFRLQRVGALDEAVRMLELLEVSTENRPQPKRSLALALITRGKARGSAGVADLERAFTLLTGVALDPGKDGYSGGDFDGIETVALMEANALIPLIEKHGGSWYLDGKLVALLDTDVRIVIEWTNDDADIDLWVIEPTGEKTFYGNRESKAGGAITNDMTDGYGPEEYVLRRATAGEYRVKIDGYSPDRLNPNGKGRVMVRLIRDFARANESEELVDAELSFERGEDEDDGDGKLVAKLKMGENRR